MLFYQTLVVIAALILDSCLGEPRRFHPLVGFGSLANTLENRFNTPDQQNEYTQLFLGGFSVTILVLPWVLFAALAISSIQASWLTWTVETLALYWAIGNQSLKTHVKRVSTALVNDQHENARRSLALIVSRETDKLSTEQITQATIETTLENGSDAIFAPIFWYIVLGVPGVILYRLINTLDAMWGYKNFRFVHFGMPAARLDDALNYIPARLVAFSYAILGNTKTALHCWRTQSPLLPSPNAGPVMTSGAGSLSVQLGGPAYYHGELLNKPYFGINTPPLLVDITRAQQLVQNTLTLWCGTLLITSALPFHFLN